MPIDAGPASPPTIAVDQLGFFRWGRIAGKVLITTDGGDWAFLDEPEFAALLAGEIRDGHPRHAELRAGGFLRDGLDLDALAARLAPRVRHVARGPERHVVTITRPGDAGAGLESATASRIVEIALQSTSPSITFELQGHAGEPLLLADRVRDFVECAQATNLRAAGKTLRFTVLTNLSRMTEETAEWLIENDVGIRTWLDGPAALHDANRCWSPAGAHGDVIRWIGYFARRYGDFGRDPAVSRVDTRITVTRPMLGAWRDIVDEYVARGIRTIDLRPLDPAGVGAEAWKDIGYGADEWLAFYERAFEYLLEVNRSGVFLSEATAATFVDKILRTGDPAAGEIRSPCAAGTSEVAYDGDGRVFPGDAARRVGAAGDPFFALGHVRELTLADVVRHPTVRTIAAASLLAAQPMCADCWNEPFCGISPITTYVREGDLFGQRPRSFECKEHMAIGRTLFSLLANASDPGTTEILRSWTSGTR